MTANLVDLVMQQVGGNVPGILGSLLGESADRTSGAVAGAVPAVLGGLMGLASKGEEGISQLQVAADHQGDGMLDDLTGMLGDGNHTAVIEQGGNMLRSLLGDGMVGTLVGAIGKSSGLGSGSSKSLLGLVAPIVMSVLSRQKKEQGLDGGGLANLLMGQKDNIQSAMPSGLMDALGGADVLSGMMGTATGAVSGVAGSAAGAVSQAASVIGEAADTAGDAASRAANTATAAAVQGGEAVGRAAETVVGSASEAASGASAAAAGAAKSGGSMFRWLLPLIILLVLLWLAYTFISGGTVEETVSDAGGTVSSAVEATTEAASDAASAAGDAASSAVEATTEAASDAASAAGDAASSAVEATTEAASDAASAAGDVASSAVEATTEAASDAASAAGDVASSAVEATTEAASDAAGSASEAVSAMVGDIDVGGELTSTFDGLTDTLSGITDVASAEAALPKLEEMGAGLDNLTGLADQLPESAVGGIAELVSSGISSLDSVIANLESLPGVGDVLKPIVDQIKEKLAAFTPA